MDGGVALAGLLLLLLGGGKKPGASSPAAAAPPASAASDGAGLLARANQAPAQQWIPIFMEAGATPVQAAAMARWAGLESSGNPRPQPPGNGGGLMQVGRGYVDMGAMSKAEYARLTSPSTSSKEQAVLALKYVRWCTDQAARLVALPMSADPADQMWFAYYYQQRPVDVRDLVAPLARQLSTTDARTLADVLGPSLKTNDQRHRLRAANVVAFDAPGAA